MVKGTACSNWQFGANLQPAHHHQGLEPLDAFAFEEPLPRQCVVMLHVPYRQDGDEIPASGDRSDLVTATMEIARLHPDLYQTLFGRFSKFVRAELGKLAGQATSAGHELLSDVEIAVLGDTVVALLAHYAGPTGASISRERLSKLVNHVLLG